MNLEPVGDLAISSKTESLRSGDSSAAWRNGLAAAFVKQLETSLSIGAEIGAFFL